MIIANNNPNLIVVTVTNDTDREVEIPIVGWDIDGQGADPVIPGHGTLPHPWAIVDKTTGLCVGGRGALGETREEIINRMLDLSPTTS